MHLVWDMCAWWFNLLTEKQQLKILYGEISMERFFYTAKFPCAKFLWGKISYGEIYLQQNFLTRNFLTAKFPYREISHHDVDDSFSVFKNLADSVLFRNYISIRYSNINFTIEQEVYSQLSFWDCYVARSRNKLISSLFRKPNFSNLGISFFPFCSFRFEVGAIKTLLFHACNLSAIISCIMN